MNLAFGILMFFLILIGLISIIGLFWSQWNKKTKKPWVISITLCTMVFLGSVVIYNNLQTPEQKNTLSAQREQQRTEKELPVSVQNKQSSAGEVTPLEAIVASIASKKLGSSFKKIEIKDFIDDPSKKIILIHYRGNSGYDNVATKNAMLIQTADLFRELFNSDIPVHEINAFVYANVQSSSGFREGLVMKCQLKSNTAATIKWNSINKAAFDKNLDEVWFAPAFSN